MRDGKNRWEKVSFRIFAWVMTMPRLFALGGWMMRHLPVMKVGPVRAWTEPAGVTGDAEAELSRHVEGAQA